MKMKKLLKNAVVYAVAFSMLVATPLTASAGLIDAYKVTDGSGNVIKDNPELGDEDYTGTVTNTYTDTSTGVISNNDAKIIGISIDQKNVSMVAGDEIELEADVLFDSAVPTKDLEGKKLDDGTTIEEQISKFIRWETSDLTRVSIKVDASDRSKATLTARHGTKLGEDVIITASIGGSQYSFTYTDEDGNELTVNGANVHYEDTASVYVKEYTNSLAGSFANVSKTQYKKHTLNLYDELKRDPETANDTIKWTTSKASVATVSAAGVVTFKNTGDVRITAISEKGKWAFIDFTVEPGKAAESVEIREIAGPKADPSAKITKDTIDVAITNDANQSVSLEAVMFAKNETGQKKSNKEWTTEDGQKITDVITWSLDKKGKSVVTMTVDKADSNKVTLTPLKKGKATITAKATNGKNAKFTLTVKATLTGLKVTNVSEKNAANLTTLYTGQTLQLDLTRLSYTHENWTSDKVKYSILKEEDNTKNPNATISSKGVLTVNKELKKLDVNPDYKTVEIQVTSKSKIKNPNTTDPKDYVKSVVYQVNLEQSSVSAFTVIDDATGKEVAKIAANAAGTKATQSVKNQTVNLYVPKGRSFTVQIDDANPVPSKELAAQTLNWKTSSAKAASIAVKDGKPTITANAKGKSTITVSGVFKGKNDQYKDIKATFKVNVTQPITSLKMNKTSVVVKQQTAKKTVALKVTKNKNAAGKITWTVYKNGVQYATKTSTSASYTVTLKKKDFVATDVFTVTAKSDTGVVARSKITVVSPSKSLTLKNGNSSPSTDFVNKKFDLPLYGELKLVPEVKIDDETTLIAGQESSDHTKLAAGVTYSVDKKGKANVSIIGNTIYRIGTGKATITAKTDDGKTYKLTLPAVQAPSN